MTAFILSFFNLIGLAGSFGYQIFIGATFGAGVELDSFFVSSTIPQFVITIFGGSISIVLIPVFVSAFDKGGMDEVWEVLSNLLTPSLFVFTLVAGFVFSLSHCFVDWLTPGLNEPGKSVANELLRIQCASIPLQVLSLIAGAVGNALQRYVIVGISSLAGLSALFIITLLTISMSGVKALSYGILAYSIVQFLFLLPLIRKGFRFRLTPFTPEFIGLYKKLSPVIGGSIYFKTDQFVDRYLVSYSPPGSVTCFSYASKVVMSLGSIISSGLTTIAFTDLSTFKMKNQPGDYVKVFQKSFVTLLLMLVPLCFFIWVAGMDALLFFLRRGRLTHDDVLVVYTLVLGFLGVLIAGALGSLSANSFYALRDVRTPTVIGILGYTFGVVFKIIGFQWIGLLGVALATSTYYGLNLLTQLVLLNRRTKIFGGKETWKRLGLIFFGSALASLVTKWVSATLLCGLTSWLRGVISFLVFGVLYVLFLKHTKLCRADVLLHKIGFGIKNR